MYMKIVKLLFGLSIVVLAAACSGDKIDYVPGSAKLEYDVNYSEDLKSSGIAGQFLPRKLLGVYSEEGVKLSTTGALGMFKLDIVLTPQKSFVVVDLEDQHMMMELNQILNDMATVSTDSFVTILNDDTLFEIAGWHSKLMTLNCNTKEKLGNDLKISVFYVPADFEREFKFVENAPMTKIPGMITAMSIQLGVSNVLATLNNVEDTKVEPSNFFEPRNCRNVSLAEVDSLFNKYMK